MSNPLYAPLWMAGGYVVGRLLAQCVIEPMLSARSKRRRATDTRPATGEGA